MPTPNKIPNPGRFHQNRAHYERLVMHMLVTTNRRMNDLHWWENPFVSSAAKKGLAEAIRHSPNCVQFTATVISHVIEARPFRDRNYETASACLKDVLGCTGYLFDGDDSELERFLRSMRDFEHGCYPHLYGWLVDRVRRIDGKPEEKVY